MKSWDHLLSRCCVRSTELVVGSLTEWIVGPGKGRGRAGDDYRCCEMLKSFSSLWPSLNSLLRVVWALHSSY